MAKVFWLEPLNLYEISLRRFVSTSYETDAAGEKDWSKPIEQPCPLKPGKYSYHNVHTIIGRVEAAEHPVSGDHNPEFPHTDSRWPTQCACGFAFRETDSWQANYDRLHSGALDGQLYTLRTAPIGAMWDAYWLAGWRQGPDGLTLTVKTPGGDWTVDGECSNCTDPARNHPETIDGKVVHQRTHHCWVRHGDPRTGNIHVDKDGPTCAAGAGSIQMASYHGFLHHGHLTDC